MYIIRFVIKYIKKIQNTLISNVCQSFHGNEFSLLSFSVSCTLLHTPKKTYINMNQTIISAGYMCGDVDVCGIIFMSS